MRVGGRRAYGGEAGAWIPGTHSAGRREARPNFEPNMAERIWFFFECGYSNQTCL